MLLDWTDDAIDPQYEISADAGRRLEAATDARGRAIEVVPAPDAPGRSTITAEEAAGVDAVAGTLPRHAGDRLAASYVELLHRHRRVVVPLLDPAPRRRGRRRSSASSSRTARWSASPPARSSSGGGNIHCITQQVPAARP